MLRRRGPRRRRPAGGTFPRPPADHGDGPVPLRVDRRSPDLARRRRRGLRARDRQQEEGRIRHRAVDRPRGRVGAAAPVHGRAAGHRRRGGRRTGGGSPSCARWRRTASRSRRRSTSSTARASEARALTDLAKGAASPAWSPTGRAIAFTSTTTAADLARAAARRGGERESDVRVITSAVYRSNSRGYLDASRPTHVWTVDVPANGEPPPPPRQVTTGTSTRTSRCSPPTGRASSSPPPACASRITSRRTRTCSRCPPTAGSPRSWPASTAPSARPRRRRTAGASPSAAR